MAAKTKAKREEISRLRERYSRILGPAGREEVSGTWQNRSRFTRKIRMGGSSVSDTLADLSVRLREDPGAQHVDTQGLSQVVLHQGEETSKARMTRDIWQRFAFYHHRVIRHSLKPL